MNSNGKSRRNLENEIQSMKKRLNRLASKNEGIRDALEGKAKSDQIGSNLLALFKHVTQELDRIEDRLDKIDANFNSDYVEQEDQDQGLFLQENNKLAKVQPLSGLDVQILQIVQSSDLACAEDIRKQMNYRGKNAASARLNKLYKQGLLERFQLGHKVYYKFDAGKTTNTLIVSPPQ